MNPAPGSSPGNASLVAVSLEVAVDAQRLAALLGYLTEAPSNRRDVARPAEVPARGSGP